MVHSSYTILCTGSNHILWDVLKDKDMEEWIQLALKQRYKHIELRFPLYKP